MSLLFQKDAQMPTLRGTRHPVSLFVSLRVLSLYRRRRKKMFLRGVCACDLVGRRSDISGYPFLPRGDAWAHVCTDIFRVCERLLNVSPNMDWTCDKRNTKSNFTGATERADAQNQKPYRGFSHDTNSPHN